MAGTTSLKEALIAHGVKAVDLDALEAFPAYRGLGVVERVYRAGLIPDAKLVEAFVDLGAVDATQEVLAGMPPPAALGAFTRALAERHRALPLRIDKRRLIVALLDPSDTTTLERLSFTCGLVVEPRSCRPRVLFEALAHAYDIAVVRPEPLFLETRKEESRKFTPVPALVAEPAPAPPGQWSDQFLPPPSTDAGVQAFSRVAAADQASPIARSIVEAADVAAGAGIDIDVDDAPRSLLASRAPRDLRPATTPRLDEAALERIRALPPLDHVAARDSLPPMILPLLVPPLRTCALFLVRQQIAIGWDLLVRDGGLPTGAFRDVLLPLTADSVLQAAFESRQARLGNPRDPSTMERTLFRFLRMAPPRSYGAIPILVGEDPIALLYFDRDDGDLDDLIVEDTRRVCSTLADALAPLAAAESPLVDRWTTGGGALGGRRPGWERYAPLTPPPSAR